MNRVEGAYVLVDIKTCISRLEIAGEMTVRVISSLKITREIKYVILMETTVCVSLSV